MDQRLRALEHAAKVAPDDAEAGRAYLLALERSGDAVGCWRERWRLASAGDPQCANELAALPAGLRAEPATHAQRVIERWVQQVLTGPDWLGIRRGPAGLSGLNGLDLHDLAIRWTVSQRLAAVTGPLLAHADDHAVAVVDGRTGRSLARWETSKPPTSLMWVGPRLLVGVGQQRLLLDDGGRTLAKARVGAHTRFGAGGGLLFRDRGGENAQVEHLDLDLKTVRWRASGTFVAADAHGVLVDDVLQRGRGRLRALDLQGVERWSIPALSRPHLAHARLVREARVDRQSRLQAIDRATGATGWEHPVKGELLDLALAADVVYAAIDETTNVRLMALDLDTGEPLWELERPRVVPGGRTCELGVLDGALFLAIQRPGKGGLAETTLELLRARAT